MGKRKSKKDIENLTRNFLYSSKRNSWSSKCLDFTEHEAYFNFLNVLLQHPELENVYDINVANKGVQHGVKELSLKSKSEFDQSDFEALTKYAIDYINANAQSYWIFIPLKDTQLDTTIEFENVAIITGTEQDKLKTITRLSGLPNKEIQVRYQHTKNNKDPYFYRSPILGIKTKNQFENVCRDVEVYSQMLISTLYIIYWGIIFPAHPPKIFCFRPARVSLPVHRQAIVFGEHNWNHVGLGLNLICDLDLNWLSQKKHQDLFLEILEEVLELRHKDRLRYRFFKGMAYFLKAIFEEKRVHRCGDLDISLLYLIIIAEGLLVERNASKRFRLKTLLPKLAEVSGTTAKEREDAVDKTYTWRSEFVHAGEQIYMEWDQRPNADSIKRHFELLKRMIAKLLCDAPKHIQRLENEHPNNDTDKHWFHYLRGFIKSQESQS